MRFYENGDKLEPLEYSTGKNQAEVTEEIIDFFETEDIVFLRGVVGSGKSAIGIRAALEMGRGIVSVPTKMLSRQYMNDYSKGEKYFLDWKGDKADISMLQGRSNHQCPFMVKRNPTAPEWKTNCQGNYLPCTRPIDEYESRKEALEVCEWAGMVKQGSDFDGENFDSFEQYYGLKGDWTVMLKKGPDGEECPYWGQYRAFAQSDIAALNSMKFKIECWIGRLPQVPLIIIDEADLFLDNLCNKTTISQKRISNLVDEIRRNEGAKHMKDRVKSTWNNLRDGEIEPFEAVGKFHVILEDADWDCKFYWDLNEILMHEDKCSYEIETDRYDRKKYRFVVADPRPILEEMIGSLNTNILFMSATIPEREVLNEIFGIDPVIVEGEPSFPGTIVKRKTGDEMKVNYDNWNGDGFKKMYSNTRDEIIRKAEKPAFVPVHATKYLPDSVDEDELTDNSSIEENGVHYSTKMDRGADLGEMNSVIILKQPFPSLGDSLLQAMKKRLGENKFWDYYGDLARREFIQQVGRVIREKDAQREFWSPDEHCHEALEEHWRGSIKRVIKGGDLGV